MSPDTPPASRREPADHHVSAHGRDGDIHLLDRVAVIYRYRAVAISLFVLTTAAVVLQSSSAVPMYRATTRILIENERSTDITGLGSEYQFYEDPELYYNTQHKILQGRDLARRVIAKLGLDRSVEFTGIPQQRTGALTGIRQLAGRLRDLVTDGEPAPDVEVAATPDESAIVDMFISRIVVEPVRGSRLVDLSFHAYDAELSATVVNTLAEEYVEQNLAVRMQATESMLEWLGRERANQEKKVQEAEARLADYRERQNAMSLDDKTNIVMTRLNQVNAEVLEAKSRKAKAEVLYKQIRALTRDELADAPPIAQHPQVAAAKARVQQAQTERARLAERYLEKHPEVLKANATLQEAVRQYDLEVSRAAEAIKTDYETAALEEQTFTSNLNAAKEDAQALSRSSVDYNLMEREANSNRAVYQALLNRENELRVSSNSRANNVRIADRAEVPAAPQGSGRRAWPLALALGVVLAVAVPFMLDYINDTVKTPDEVARLKLPFLGLVPSVRGSQHLLMTSAQVPHDFSEAFRSLRTSLLSRVKAGGKIVIFTSAQPLEGKTTTAVNLAMALAYGGARVLVIDADMRRPGLHRPLGLRNDRGLSQVLVGEARIRDVIQRTVEPNLVAVTAGRTPSNPSELLSSERMKMLLTNMGNSAFDWVIIDTPPVLAVSDAVILAPHASGVTFVIGAEMTRRRLAERAVDNILSSKPRQVMVVLNRVDFARNKYYYSRYYGHQYKDHYAQAT